MNFDDYNTLEKIAGQINQELNSVEDKIKYNLQCIKEAEVYAGLLIDSEPDDFKIFSPRNAEYVHRNEIEKA